MVAQVSEGAMSFFTFTSIYDTCRRKKLRLYSGSIGRLSINASIANNSSRVS